MLKNNARALGAGLVVAAVVAATSIGFSTPAFAAVPRPSSQELRVALGWANGYSALAGAAITAPASVITHGKVGAGAALTMDAATQIPADHIKGGAEVAVALSDLSDGYQELRALPADLLPGAADLGGQTFQPGVYHSDAALTSSGTITFDGANLFDPVFVFHTDAAFSTTAGTQMNLINGATAADVYWIVDAASTVGAGSDFKGTIISNDAITVGAGAVVTGRLMSVGAAITLDANVVDSSMYAGHQTLRGTL